MLFKLINHILLSNRNCWLLYLQEVQEAVESVRKEKGFAMIINAQAGAATSIVLASDEAYDITKDVFNKLGVEMPEAPAESADGNN